MSLNGLVWAQENINSQEANAAHETSLEHDDVGLPPGIGREDVFGLCQACHSLKIVTQQRLDRKAWKKNLEWMQEQGLPELDPEMTERILDYLSQYFSPTTPR